jgi:predicted phage terminase large subunit-like protein
MTSPSRQPRTAIDYVSSLSTDQRRRFLNEAYRTDFHCFAHRALIMLHGKVEWNWHHQAMAEWAQQIAEGERRFSMVNLPPRTLKSDIFSAVMPAWILGRNPAAKIICLSHGQDLGEKLAIKTRRVMDSAFYKEAFPATRLTKRALSDLRTDAGGYRTTTSIGGGVTGQGGDFIIIDDPMKADDAESDAVRNGVNDWMSSTLFSRLDDPRTGRMVLVAQRLHQDDPCGRLQEGRAWEVLSIPAIATRPQAYDLGRGRMHTQREGDLVHPVRLSATDLAMLRLQMGERKFEAQYQQAPVPADGSFFRREWLKFDEGGVSRRAGDKVIQSWDVAAKTGDSHDYSVCITAIVRKSQVLVIDVLRARLTFPQLMKAVFQQNELHRPWKLLIEDASAGQQLIQMIEAEQPRGMPLPIKVKPINSKQDRASIASARCERGELVLPTRAPWLDSFVHELMAFPVGRHDDQVDALAHLMTYTQKSPIRAIAPHIAGGRSDFIGFGRDPGAAGD